MAKYRLSIKPSARKELVAVATKKDRQRIVRLIQSLAEEPRPPGCQKLSGYDRYRVRQGNYRILYQIQDNELVVVMVRIGHRREVYRGR
ncbi:MAG: type II toxin-antitoxin system RelE/ParE family toxin [Gammaproteobacteria bacterium]